MEFGDFFASGGDTERLLLPDPSDKNLYKSFVWNEDKLYLDGKNLE